MLHVACAERPSVAELVRLVADARGVAAPRLDPTRRAPLLTVDVGAIDVGLAKRTLAWEPTPLQGAIRATVAWYADDRHVAYTRGLEDGSSSSSSSYSSSDSEEEDAGPRKRVRSTPVDFKFDFFPPDSRA